jgi:hypothetical protein
LKKLAFAIFLVVLMICGLPFVDITPLGMAQTSQTVNGIITQNITWTKTNSPYNLTGNVLIHNGTTVTVEAGAVVNLNGYYIMVNGSLIVQQGVTINMQNAAHIQVNGLLSAIGTNKNPIQINGDMEYFHIAVYYSTLIFSQNSLGWNQQAASGSIIENAILNMTSVQVSNSVKLTNNTFAGVGFSVSAGSPLISNNMVSAGVGISGGSPIISNNTILAITCMSSGDSFGFVNGQEAVIVDNVFLGSAFSGTGIALAGNSLGTNLRIERNLISNYRDAGIEISMYSDVNCAASIVNNTITNNGVGINIINGYPQPINNNNIYNNKELNVKLWDADSVDCTNNWWGSTDQQAITQSIYDFKNDFNLGTVNFVPFLTEANSQALPDPNAPLSTPTQTPTPTTSPTSPPTPSESPTPPTSSGAGTLKLFGLDWAEIVAVVLLGVIAVLLVFVVVFLREKK